MTATNPNLTQQQEDVMNEIADRIEAWAREHGYIGTIEADEARAVRRCQMVESLGFKVDRKYIAHELQITRETNARKARVTA